MGVSRILFKANFNPLYRVDLHSGLSKIFPGFISQWESSAYFKLFIRAKVSTPTSCSKALFWLIQQRAHSRRHLECFTKNRINLPCKSLHFQCSIHHIVNVLLHGSKLYCIFLLTIIASWKLLSVETVHRILGRNSSPMISANLDRGTATYVDIIPCLPYAQIACSREPVFSQTTVDLALS
jgi:hypothetical protein